MTFLKLALTALLFTVSLLTIVKAPGLWGWKLAILAGEFGQFLCILPLATGIWILASFTGKKVFSGTSFALCILSAGIFLKPSFEAASIAKELPEKLADAFGHAGKSDAFSWTALFKVGVNEVAVKTFTYRKDSNGNDIALDFYRAESRSPMPCVVVIHGGGWDEGDRTEIANMNHWLASRGFAVAAIDYRLAPESKWPAQLDDVRAALDFLKSSAAALGINGKQFVLFGRSAGGQIATAAATGLQDSAVLGVASFYAPQDLVFAWKYADENNVLDSRGTTQGVSERTARRVSRGLPKRESVPER